MLQLASAEDPEEPASSAPIRAEIPNELQTEGEHAACPAGAEAAHHEGDQQSGLCPSRPKMTGSWASGVPLSAPQSGGKWGGLLFSVLSR